MLRVGGHHTFILGAKWLVRDACNHNVHHNILGLHDVAAVNDSSAVHVMFVMHASNVQMKTVDELNTAKGYRQAFIIKMLHDA